MNKAKVNSRTIFTQPITCHFLNQRFLKKVKIISNIKLTLSDPKKLTEMNLG